MAEQLGWLDTNIFVHAVIESHNEHPRCNALIAALRSGRAEAYIDVTVVHELTYVLLRLRQFRTREAVREYVDSILRVEAIHAEDKDVLRAVLGRWATFGMGFVDAWLRASADRTGLPVCSANAKDFPDVQNSFLNASV